MVKKGDCEHKVIQISVCEVNALKHSTENHEKKINKHANKKKKKMEVTEKINIETMSMRLTETNTQVYATAIVFNCYMSSLSLYKLVS